MQNLAIEATDLRKTFRSLWKRREIRALDGLSVCVRSGACFGLVGPAGSGKSTFLNILRSAVAPDSGRIAIFGRPVGKDNLPHWATPKTLFTVSPVRTGLLIMDDPFEQADAAEGLKIRAMLLQCCRAGATVLVSSRRLSQVDTLCGEIAILREGRVVAAGCPDELRIPCGYRVVVASLPELLQERLANRGYMLGLAGRTCWIEAHDRHSLNLLIDELRSAGAWIEGVQNLGTRLERWL